MQRFSGLVLLFTVAACGHPAPLCTGICVAPAFTRIDLLAGRPGGNGWVDGPIADAHFSDPWIFAGDGAGHLYLIDGSIIRAIDEASGMVTTLAGTFGVVGGMDGVGATATFHQPNGLALAGGTLYVADTENHALRAIDVATATVTTFAGMLGVPGTADGDAGSARFREPEGIALDGAGSLYVADTDNGTIRRILLATGAVSTIAGTAGVVGSADGVGPAASFNKPKALAADGAGHLYVGDSGNSTIRVVTLADNSVTTRANFAMPPLAVTSVAADGADVLVSLGDQRVVRIDGAGAITTVAGAAGMSGFVDGPAADARFFRPAGLWVGNGRILVADNGNYVVRAIAAGSVTTAWGAVTIGTLDGSGADARFFAPQGLAVDGSNLYVADTNNHTIRHVDLQSGAVTTVAGAAGRAAYADGTAGEARFDTPTGIALDASGHTLYVADANNRSIRAVDVASGAVTTLPLSGAPGSMFARFNTPAGLARDGTRLYASDSSDHIVVAVDLATNLVTIVAGSPRIAGATNGTGSQAHLNAPSGLAADGRGALYVADVLNEAVRKIDLASGAVTTVAGVLGIPGSDDGPAAAAHFAYPTALAGDGLGDLFVGDASNGVVRRIDLARATVTTPIGVIKLPGVHLGPLPAQIGQPTALALTPEGHLIIASENALLVAR